MILTFPPKALVMCILPSVMVSHPMNFELDWYSVKKEVVSN